MTATVERSVPNTHNIDPELEARLIPMAEALTSALWYATLALLPAMIMCVLNALAPFDYSSILCWFPAWLGCLL
jgi:hypothetical protein